MKQWNIYFTDGEKLTFENFFAFNMAKNSLNNILRVTVEEDYVNLQEECMMALKKAKDTKEQNV